MLTTTFFMKLILMPLFTALVAYVQKRWSAKLGGAVSGLPLTAGPISAFLAIEQGLPFARAAAEASMYGYFATSAYAVVFILLSKRWSWPVCLVGGLMAWVVCAYLLTLLVLPLSAKIAFGFLTMILNTVFVFSYPVYETPRAASLPYDIPIRAVAVLVPLLIVTGLASLLGPNSSGILGGCPAMWSVLFPFTLAHAGRTSIISFFKGAVLCALGYYAFFFTILFVPLGNLAALYIIASVLASVFGLIGYHTLPRLQMLTAALRQKVNIRA